MRHLLQDLAARADDNNCQRAACVPYYVLARVGPNVTRPIFDAVQWLYAAGVPVDIALTLTTVTATALTTENMSRAYFRPLVFFFVFSQMRGKKAKMFLVSSCFIRAGSVGLLSQ